MNNTDIITMASLNSSYHSVNIHFPPPPPLTPESPSGVEKFPGNNIVSMEKCPASSSEIDDDSCNSSVGTTVVNFYPKVRIRATISHQDMSMREHKNCWFQDYEYDQIRQRNIEILDKIEDSQDTDCKFVAGLQPIKEMEISESNDSDNEEFCLRGLENSLRHQHKRRKALQKKAIIKVLVEQALQSLWGIYNDEDIAKVYMKIARKCRFRAEVRALRDRSEIEDYLLEGCDPMDFEDYLLAGLGDLEPGKKKRCKRPRQASRKSCLKKNSSTRKRQSGI